MTAAAYAELHGASAFVPSRRRVNGTVALRCIEAGRHVLVEKPLADSLAAGVRIVRAAEEYGVALHCDHTFCYAPAVQRIRDMVAGGRPARRSTTTRSA